MSIYEIIMTLIITIASDILAAILGYYLGKKRDQKKHELDLGRISREDKLQKYNDLLHAIDKLCNLKPNMTVGICESQKQFSQLDKKWQGLMSHIRTMSEPIDTNDIELKK